MKRRIFYVALLVVALVGIVPPAYAQFEPKAVVIKPISYEADGRSSLELSVLFTLYDSNGRPIAKDAVTKFDGVQIQLPTSPAVPATVEPADMPIKITLVIDASGSMVQRIVPTKAAAIHFVKAAPANAQIAIFKFSEEIEKIQDFTGRRPEDIAALESAINSIETRRPYEGDTCLYKAAFEALNAFTANNEAVAERRTVVLFTDGIDRQNGGKNCGTAQEADVIAKAKAALPLPIQVHTIGLCGPEDCGEINIPGLKHLADETRGASATGDVGELNQLFGTILSALNNQWIAKADLLTVKGTNNANVSFKADINGVQTPFAFSSGDFTSQREYSKSPRVSIVSRRFDSSKNQYDVVLKVDHPDQIKQITVTVRDDGNNTIPDSERTVDEIMETMTVTHTAKRLKDGSEFFTDIQAIDLDGKEILNEKGENVVSMPGKYTPDEKERLGFKLPPPMFNSNTGTFEIEIKEIQIPSGMRLIYEGFISAGTAPIMNIPSGVLNEERRISVTLPDGERQALKSSHQSKDYTIEITLIDQIGGQKATNTITTNASPPAVPTLGQKIIAALGNPLVLGSSLVIVVVVAGVVVAATLIKENRRPQIGRPIDLHGPPTELGQKSTARRALAARDSSGGATEIHDSEPELRIRFVETPDAGHNQDRVIKRFPCVIGRKNSAFLIQGDGKISRQHAQLSLEGSNIVVEDLGSSNGTAFVVRDSSGAYTVTKKIPKQGSAVWDNHSLIRIGTKTVIELIPQGTLQAGTPRTQMSGFDNRTEIAG